MSERRTELAHAIDLYAPDGTQAGFARAWTLNTDDAHGLYAKFGFTAPRQPEGDMEWRRPVPPGAA